MNKKIMLAFLLAASLALTACSGAKSDASAPVPPGGALVKVAGSTSVGPLMEELVISFEDSGSAVSVEVQQTGSSAGITAAIDGAADVGMSSRDLDEKEKNSGLVEQVIALDGISVVVHSDNSIQDLTTQQIRDIFSGKISKWSELGGEDKDIIVVSREEGSGTRTAFEELLGLEETIEKDGVKTKQSLLTGSALFENSTGAVKTTVSTTKTAIGYISLGTLDDTVKALSVDGAACSADNVKNGSYPIARPFLLCTMGEPQGPAAELIDFILSPQGQSVVTEHHYISVSVE